MPRKQINRQVQGSGSIFQNVNINQEWEILDMPQDQMIQQQNQIMQMNQQPGPQAEVQQRHLKRLNALKSMIDKNKMKYYPANSVLTADFKNKFSSKISDGKRADALRNDSSRLYRKRQNANLLNEVRENEEKECLDKLSSIISDDQMIDDAEDYYDISVFMTKNAAINERIVSRFWGEGENHEGQEKRKALDQMLSILLEMDLSDIRLDNDTEIAGNSKKLEQLTRRIAAFDHLAGKNGYFDSLDGAAKADIEGKLEKIRSVAYYYTMRREVMTDAYYISHYNDELSMDVTAGKTDQQKAVAKKLLNAFVAGRYMMEKNGASAALIKKQGKPVFANKSNGEQQLREAEKAITQNRIGTILREKYSQRISIEKRDESRFKTVSAKAQLKEKLISQIKDYNGLLEYQDEYKEKAYSEDKAKEYIKQLETINLRDMKFASYPQMIENLAHNQALCNRVNILHGEIMRALMNGMEIPERQLLDIRAKCMAFSSMHATLLVVCSKLVEDKDCAQYTKDQWDSLVEEKFSNSGVAAKAGDPNEIFAQCSEYVWEEDSVKDDSIRDTWKYLISENDNEEISPQELSQRRKKYTANAVIDDYITKQNLLKMYDLSSTYDLYLTQKDKEQGIHKKANGFDAERSFASLCRGKSAKEVERLHKLYMGTKEQQYELCLELIKTVKSVPLEDYNAQDIGNLSNNWVAKSRVANLVSDGVKHAVVFIKQMLNEQKNKKPEEQNLKLPEPYESLEQFEKEMDLLYDIGQAVMAGRTSSIEQIPNNRWMHAMSIKEMGSYTREKTLKIDKKIENLTNSPEFETKMGKSMERMHAHITNYVSAIDDESSHIDLNGGPEHITFDMNVKDLYENNLKNYETNKVRLEQRDKAQNYNSKFSSDIYRKNNKAFDTEEKKYAKGKLDVGGYSRQTHVISNCIGFLKSKGEAPDVDIQKLNISLLYIPDKMSDEEAEDKAKALEYLMKVIKDVDLSRFEFDKPEDVLSEDKIVLRTFSAMAFEMDFIFTEYEKLRTNPKFADKQICSITIEEANAIKEKKGILQSIEKWYHVLPQIYEDSLSYSFDVNKLLSMPLEEIAELSGKPEMVEKYGGVAWNSYIGKLMDIRFTLEDENLKGYQPGVGPKSEI